MEGADALFANVLAFEKEEKIGTKIQFTVMMKNELIEALQKFVLDELEK